MGSCWPGERSNRSELSTPLPKIQQQRLENIRVDANNPLLSSYRQVDKEVFEKTVYDWKSIPIVSMFHCRGKAYFEVKNRGIKDNNFVVGVIKRSALTTQLPMPWRTPYCICYESHQNAGQSGLIYEGKVTKAGDGIVQDGTIKIIMGQEDIQFKFGKRSLAYMKLPVGFLSDEILPYVALFHSGDKIEFLHPVSYQ